MKNIFIREGTLNLSQRSQDNGGKSSVTHVNGSGFGVNFDQAVGMITAKPDGISLTLDKGRARIELQDSPTLFVNEGQSMIKDRAGIGIYQRLARPQLSSEKSGVPSTHIRWTPVPNAVNYVVEYSHDLNFFKHVKRFEKANLHHNSQS